MGESPPSQSSPVEGEEANRSPWEGYAKVSSRERRRRGALDGGGGKLADGLADAPVGVGEIELGLKVEPELGVYSEPVAEPKGGVAGYRTSSCDNLADAVGRHVNLAGKGGGGYAIFNQFVFQNHAGVNRSLQHLDASF